MDSDRPKDDANPRSELGLPNTNTADRMATGRIVDTKRTRVRAAKEYDGNLGGAPEVYVIGDGPVVPNVIEIFADVPFAEPTGTEPPQAGSSEGDGLYAQSDAPSGGGKRRKSAKWSVDGDWITGVWCSGRLSCDDD